MIYIKSASYSLPFYPYSSILLKLRLILFANVDTDYRLLPPGANYADEANNRADYEWSRLIGMALIMICL